MGHLKPRKVSKMQPQRAEFTEGGGDRVSGSLIREGRGQRLGQRLGLSCVSRAGWGHPGANVDLLLSSLAKGEFSWPLETENIVNRMDKAGELLSFHPSGIKGTDLPVGRGPADKRVHSLGTERRGGRPHSPGEWAYSPALRKFWEVLRLKVQAAHPEHTHLRR